MFHFWIGDVNLKPFLLLFTFVVLFPLQLLLCFKGSSKPLRLIPVILLSVLTGAAILMAILCSRIGGDVALFLVSAAYLSVMLLVCGVSWGIWAILRRIIKSMR